MKKIISILLAALMVVSLSIASVESAFAEETASITIDGNTPISMNVGEVFEYTFCLNASQNKIVNGEARTLYTGECLEIVKDYAYDSFNDEYAEEPYMFPLYYNKNVIYNTSIDSQILYNFTSAKGAAYFNNDNCIFIRVKFRVIAKGNAEIETGIKYMQDTTGERIFNNYKVPAGKTVKTIGKALRGRTIIIGDADSNGGLNISDATQIQLYLAEKKTQLDANFDLAAADADRDGSLTISDATQIQKILVKESVPFYYRTGEWDVVINK